MTADGARITSPATVTTGTFHELELSVVVSGTSSTTQVWLDGTIVTALSRTVTLAASSIAQLQIGQLLSRGSYNAVFDDAAFDTTLLP